MIIKEVINLVCEEVQLVDDVTWTLLQHWDVVASTFIVLSVLS